MRLLRRRRTACAFDGEPTVETDSCQCCDAIEGQRAPACSRVPAAEVRADDPFSGGS